MLQKILEKPLEKKAGRNYGPPGNKTLVYFLDDMNMPEVKTLNNIKYNIIFKLHSITLTNTCVLCTFYSIFFIFKNSYDLFML